MPKKERILVLARLATIIEHPLLKGVSVAIKLMKGLIELTFA